MQAASCAASAKGASPARSCRLAACRWTRCGLEVPATARRKAARKVWSEPCALSNGGVWAEGLGMRGGGLGVRV